MREFTFEHAAHDFHVAVTVLAEPLACSDPVFIDDPQVAETHVFPVVVIGERERVITLQPTVVGITALLRSTN